MIEWFNNKPRTHDTTNNSRDDFVIYDCRRHEYFLDNFYSTVQKEIKKFAHEYNECYLPFKAYHDINKHPVNIIGYKMQKSTPEHTGFTTWHTERYPDLQEHHNIYSVWMIYLNNVNGGTTDFKWQNISLQPKVGTLVMWPAYFTHVHRANPNLKSNKYILTGWISYI
jgi:hypothetical protein